MRILEMLVEMQEGGVTDISERVGMHKSTTYRFLNSLVELGYARKQEHSDRYRPTLRIFELGSMVLDGIGVWDRIDSRLEQLARDTEETIHFAVLDKDRMVYLRKIESTKTLRVSMASRVGHTAPLHCTGVGKCLLAFSSSQVRDRVLENNPLTPFTDKTITDRARLCEELEGIRCSGFAVDDEEHRDGVRCVAAPVLTPDGSAIASISISAPTVRLSDEEIDRYARTIKELARTISDRFTHRAWNQNTTWI